MEYNKKFGIMFMVVSVLLASISMLLTVCQECNGIWNILQYGSIDFIESYNAEGGYYVTIPLKYSLVFCCTTFSIGFLFYLKVLNAPLIKLEKYFNKPSGD